MIDNEQKRTFNIKDLLIKSIRLTYRLNYLQFKLNPPILFGGFLCFHLSRVSGILQEYFVGQIFSYYFFAPQNVKSPIRENILR